MNETAPRCRRRLRTYVLGACVPLILACSERDTGYPSKLVYLDQGWSNTDRQTYYYTPQGTELKGVRYNWFRYLERPLSRERLADPAFLASFGFLYEPGQLLPDYDPPPYNPGNFPVGFTSHTDDVTGDAMLDITCAACHTGQIEYGGRAIRIDGGPALHAFAQATPLDEFLPTLILSLHATYANPFKFDRFARNVLGLDYPRDKPLLREKLGNTIELLTVNAWRILTGGFFPVHEGYGRIDALDHIAATVFGDDLDPANYRVGNAPVSYPHVWDIWKFDWVQWNGSVAQPMARNVGEVLVLARLALVDGYGKALGPDSLFASSALLPELHCIETTLWGLQAPTWDERYLPPIDTAKANRGAQLFDSICAHCHGPRYYADRYEQETEYKPIEWRMTVAPVWEVGTDPQVVDNFLDYRYDASALDPGNPALTEIDAGSALELVTQGVIERKYREMDIDPDTRWEWDGWGREIETRVERGYKARPLHGIWATSPYLHNGSVPNLYSMLLPEERRPATFYTGTHEFDPVKVGYVSDDSVGTFLFDTSIQGNHNVGHQFRDDGGTGVIGRALLDEERWAIVEFLKTYGSKPEHYFWSGVDGAPPLGYDQLMLPLYEPSCPTGLEGPARYPRITKEWGPEADTVRQYAAADVLWWASRGAAADSLLRGARQAVDLARARGDSLLAAAQTAADSVLARVRADSLLAHVEVGSDSLSAKQLRALADSMLARWSIEAADSLEAQSMRALADSMFTRSFEEEEGGLRRAEKLRALVFTLVERWRGDGQGSS